MKNYTRSLACTLLALTLQAHLAEASHSPMPRLDYGVPFVELFPSEGANVPYLVPLGTLKNVGDLAGANTETNAASISKAPAIVEFESGTTLDGSAAPGMSVVPEPVSLIGLIAGLMLFFGWAHRRPRAA